MTRSRALFNEAEAARQGGQPQRPLRELADDLILVLQDTLPLLAEAPQLALAVIDVARSSIWLELSRKEWIRVLGSGASLAAAVSVIRQHTDDFNLDLERELGGFVSAPLDSVLYSAVRVGLPSFVGTLSDMLLGAGYLSRQLVQSDQDDVMAAWDWATGLALNGGLEAGQEERAFRISQGDGWLSDRQRTDHSPEEVADVITAWMARSLSSLQATPLRETTGLGASGDPAEAEWKLVLGSVDDVLAQPPAHRFLRAVSVGCVTPLAAKVSGRDIIYLVESPHGGLAVRFFGGNGYRRAPEIAELPGADTRSLRQWRERIDDANSDRVVDILKRTTLLDSVREEVGDRVVAPMLDRWPDLERIALIPVGEMQDLPWSSALVGGSRWADAVNVTIAPAAASILVAATPRGTGGADAAVVMGDPASGEIYLRWIAPEVCEVAAVYGRDPDLLVEYATNPVEDPTELASRSAILRQVPSSVAITAGAFEHVLSRLENARVVHLACHGAVPDGAGSPQLFLSGRIPFEALEHHRFARGACVVLSACSVGRNVGEAPLAALGFPAMFLSIGAATVIASSWPVLDCRETVDFVVEIHRNLAEGLEPTSALSGAVSRMRADAVPSAVWGGFDVYGA